MNFTKKSYDEIFKTRLAEAVAKNLISEDENFLKYDDIENFYVLFTSIFSDALEDLYIEEENVYNSTKVDKAENYDLDDLGELVGVKRTPATYAVCSVTFELNRTLDTDTTILKDTVLNSKTGVQYKTLNTTILPAGQLKTTIPSISTVAGAKGRISTGDISKVSSQTSEHFTVYNEHNSSGGYEAQNDTEYREYIKNWQKIHQKGNAWSYKKFFRDYNGIDSYKLIPLWDGTGTIKIVIDNDDEYILNDVYSNIQENIALFDDDITVVPATNKAIDISIEANINIDLTTPYTDNDKQTIKTSIIKTVTNYIEGGFQENGTYKNGMGIGQDFIPHKLAVYLDNQINELKDINFLTPTEYIQINDDEICTLNSITVEVE